MKYLHLAVVAALATMFVGCNNYTATPLCNDENAAVVPGMVGTYEFSTQDAETFDIVTEILEVKDDKFVSKQMNKLVSGNEAESRICKINDLYINEEYDEQVQGYVQWAVHADERGLDFRRVFYDTSMMTSLGYKYKIIAMPESFAFVAKKALSVAKYLAGNKLRFLEEENLGLMVDTTTVSGEDLLKNAAKLSFLPQLLDRRK